MPRSSRSRTLPNQNAVFGKARRELVPSASGRWARIGTLPAILALILAAGRPLPAAVIVVEVFDSSTAEDGLCSLREAIAAANTDLGVGGCPAGSGPDTIELTHDVELTLEDSFQTGLPRVTSQIRIRGNGHEIARSATAEFRILWVTSDGHLTLEDVTLRDGDVSATSLSGGGIYNEGVLRLANCTVASSSAYSGGGIYSIPGASLAISRSLVTDNEAILGGGLQTYGNTAIRDSTFLLNRTTTGGAGGAILAGAGTTTVDRSTLWLNTSELGGAVAVGLGAVAWLDVTNSTISGNLATSSGGGIFSSEATVTVRHSTLWGNQSTGPTGSEGGGIRNSAGSFTVHNSIVGGSTGGNCGGTITSSGTNLADDTTCGGIPATLNLSQFDSVLADNGGPTLTHALLAASNAIGVGGSCEPLTDQRGGLRDGACDLGAYEYGADDRYEPSGSGGGDDSCFGHAMQMGRAERHLHEDDITDWVRFRPVAGATYEIETANLIGGSDTVVELWRACSTKLDENDDIDVSTLASRITRTATATDEVLGLDILIRDYSGEGIDRGYDVTLTCLSGPCVDCRLGGGPVFVLAHERIVTDFEVAACERIVGRDTVVDARAILRAGEAVELGNGFRIEAGGSLVVGIEPDLR